MKSDSDIWRCRGEQGAMGCDEEEQKQTETDWCSVDVKMYFKSWFVLHDSPKYCFTHRVYMTHFHML